MRATIEQTKNAIKTKCSIKTDVFRKTVTQY